MLVVISPAKTLDFQSTLTTSEFTLPLLTKYTQQLVDVCRKLTPEQMSNLMHISDKLAGLNTARYACFSKETTTENSRVAILAYKGEVYHGLQAHEFDHNDFLFAQQHLRILSGLYGVLRPLDLIQPHRLEMGTKLVNKKGNDLYQFWGTLIADQVTHSLKEQNDNILVNLASDEYFKAIDNKHLKAKTIKPIFLDNKSGKYKVISIYAKKARGLMTRFIIKNRLSQTEQLHQFNDEGYEYDPALSSDSEFVFKR